MVLVRGIRLLWSNKEEEGGRWEEEEEEENIFRSQFKIISAIRALCGKLRGVGWGGVFSSLKVTCSLAHRFHLRLASKKTKYGNP